MDLFRTPGHLPAISNTHYGRLLGLAPGGTGFML